MHQKDFNIVLHPDGYEHGRQTASVKLLVPH